MPFRDLFPWTSTLWRLLTSRQVRVGFCGIGGFIVLLCVCFHIQALLYAHRIKTVTRAMAAVQLGVTTREELAKALPGLERTRTPYEEACSPALCYYLTVSNLWSGSGPASNLLEHAGRLGFGKSFYRGLFLLGHRFVSFEGRIRLESGLVSGYRYNFKLDDGTYAVPGLITVEASGGGDKDLHYLSDVFDQDPEYQVLSFNEWPDKGLTIRFFSNAPSEQRVHAFQPHLSCLQTLKGCTSVQDLLPEVAEDLQRTSRSIRDRLNSAAPCPDRLIRPRIEHFPKMEIYLAEVTEISDETGSSPYGKEQIYRTAKLRRLETLHGKENLALKQMRVTEPMKIQWGIAEGIENPTAMSLKPGSRVLLFEGSELRIASACTVVPATPSSLLAVHEALEAASSEH